MKKFKTKDPSERIPTRWKITHPWQSKEKETSSNRQWTQTKNATTVLLHSKHTITKWPFYLCTDNTRTTHSWRLYHIFIRVNQFMWALYAGTAKLRSVQWVGSTTMHGSSFLNSATCRRVHPGKKRMTHWSRSSMKQEDIGGTGIYAKPVVRSWGSSAVCARGSPWRGTESIHPAWTASCKPRLMRYSASTCSMCN